MDCPNCGAAMRERDRGGVKIDFCPSCKGVWLDRGELDKIVAIELDDDDDYRRSGEYRKKSKKSSFFSSLTEMIGGEGE